MDFTDLRTDLRGGGSCQLACPVTGGAQQGGDAVSLLGGQRGEGVDNGSDVLGERRGGGLWGCGVGDGRRPLVGGVDILRRCGGSFMLSAVFCSGGAVSLLRMVWFV